MPLEQLPVDARLVVVALEVAEARELDQVPVALGRLGEQRQVRVALLLRLAVVGDVDLAADDRLHAVLLGLLDELDRARERAVVGERDRRHLELRGPRGERRDPARPVEDRELRVDVEMDEGGRFRHGKAILQGVPDVALEAVFQRRRTPCGALRSVGSVLPGELRRGLVVVAVPRLVRGVVLAHGEGGERPSVVRAGEDARP